jgi:hypothetical protein
MTWPILTILVLGIWHGINPGMGWLFAVALGMQEQERRSVWRALLPLAAGHALAIAAALAVALLIGAVVPAHILKWSVAMVLVAFGVSRIIRSRHPRYGGMRMSMRKLTVWSFLMASAHGAGLMVIPFVLADSPAERIAGDTIVPALVSDGPDHAGHGPHGADADDSDHAVARARADDSDRAAMVAESAGPTGSRGTHSEHLAGLTDSGATSGWLVLLVHTAGYLFATGLLAVLVYEKLGLRMLRTVWLNLDLIWGIALAATGVIAPFV